MLHAPLALAPTEDWNVLSARHSCTAACVPPASLSDALLLPTHSVSRSLSRPKPPASVALAVTLRQEQVWESKGQVRA